MPAATLSFSTSASWSLLALARRFWNQILTWVSDSDREEENSARSAMDRYCFWRNFLSRARSCVVVKGVRGLRLVLCFLKGQTAGMSCPRGHGKNVRQNVLVWYPSYWIWAETVGQFFSQLIGRKWQKKCCLQLINLSRKNAKLSLFAACQEKEINVNWSSLSFVQLIIALTSRIYSFIKLFIVLTFICVFLYLRNDWTCILIFFRLMPSSFK